MGAVALPGAVDVFVIVLAVVAVDILVVDDGVVAPDGRVAGRLVVAAAVGVDLGVVAADAGLLGVVEVVGRAVLVLSGCLGVADDGVLRAVVVGFAGLVVAALTEKNNKNLNPI